MRIVLITGISGSGKSVSLTALEDAGYFCVDNLPPTLLRALVATRINEGELNLAVSVDARSAISLTSLPEDIQWLKDEGHDVKIIFLTAKNESLITRFSETRRSHPLSHRVSAGQTPNHRPTLIESIRKEREMLADIKELGHVIDTSGLNASKLRRWVKEVVGPGSSTMTLLFESFGFKFGVPLDADLVFDVRVLPNPFYDDVLRPLSGRDGQVIAFLDGQAEALELLADIRSFVEKWLPSYKRDNRSYLTVAIGCTGGQHRSVYMVENLARYFDASAQVLIRHRELN